MASKDAEEYRHLAQQCRATARMVSTGEGRTNLLAMAEVWERLADQQDQGSDLTEVRGPPPAREQTAVRQQQIQPKDEEKKRIGCATKSLAPEVKQNPHPSILAVKCNTARLGVITSQPVHAVVVATDVRWALLCLECLSPSAPVCTVTTPFVTEIRTPELRKQRAFDWALA